MKSSKNNQQKQSHKGGPKIETPKYYGFADIGTQKIPCAVLKDGTPLLVQRELVGLLTGNIKGNLDRYLQPKNLQDFVPEKFKNKPLSESVYKFRQAESNQISYGYSANDIIDICNMYLQARNAGKLLTRQQHLAVKAEMIILITILC